MPRGRRLGQRGEPGTEAFSIRRLEGSRWRLRRTRPMGIERFWYRVSEWGSADQSRKSRRSTCRWATFSQPFAFERGLNLPGMPWREVERTSTPTCREHVQGPRLGESPRKNRSKGMVIVPRQLIFEARSSPRRSSGNAKRRLRPELGAYLARWVYRNSLSAAVGIAATGVRGSDSIETRSDGFARSLWAARAERSGVRTRRPSASSCPA